jgi:hypothetical protein
MEGHSRHQRIAKQRQTNDAYCQEEKDKILATSPPPTGAKRLKAARTGDDMEEQAHESEVKEESTPTDNDIIKRYSGVEYNTAKTTTGGAVTKITLKQGRTKRIWTRKVRMNSPSATSTTR